ncbi:unnamed protein product [Medioppia subpectinata]|uniref:Cytochrome P450 n=1 Tax=Medioppia subpectinata TaxID=1979941 RepID=A0A7R9LKP0_9ACAR|nr:unnamed protein product [Medioppia subpectinata]CAG2119659.1 unnamed protein product [Medioppia subpectinata]
MLIYHVARFYTQLARYPPGPTPLPFIGNILLFRNARDKISGKLPKLYETYGPVITLWLGTTPAIMISDPELIRQTFANPDAGGRPGYDLGNVFSNAKHLGLAFAQDPLYVNSMRHNIKSFMRLNDEYRDEFKQYIHTFFDQFTYKYAVWELAPGICRAFMSDPLADYRRQYYRCFAYVMSELMAERVNRTDIIGMFLAAKRRTNDTHDDRHFNDDHFVAAIMDMFIGNYVFD